MNIKTNNVPREVLQAWQLSMPELAEFDYLIDVADEDRQMAYADCGASFFRYRGELYDLGEFVRIERRSQLTNSFCHGVDDDSPLLKWDGIRTDSFFSAIVIRYPHDDTDCETVIVGEATI